jgi:hypothetical protein
MAAAGGAIKGIDSAYFKKLEGHWKAVVITLDK